VVTHNGDGRVLGGHKCIALFVSDSRAFSRSLSAKKHSDVRYWYRTPCRRLSVRLSVCHTGVFFRNGCTWSNSFHNL